MDVHEKIVRSICRLLEDERMIAPYNNHLNVLVR